MFLHHALVDIESSKFVRFGKKLSTDDLSSFWLDDITGELFSGAELYSLKVYIVDDIVPVGAMSYHLIMFMKEQGIKAKQLLCIPCRIDNDFDSREYDHSFFLSSL